VAPEGAPSDPLARRLFAAALLRGTFTLRSGVTSDRYFDKYRITCDPHLLGPIAARLGVLQRAHEPEVARVLAPALGAVPLAAALSLDIAIPFAIVRDTTKGHGTSNRIEGVVAAGERALLVEDVVTSGGAALDAVEAGRAAGLVIDHALCVLDRDGGGREALASVGVTLHAVLDASDLDAAFDAGLGTEAR